MRHWLCRMLWGLLLAAVGGRMVPVIAQADRPYVNAIAQYRAGDRKGL